MAEITLTIPDEKLVDIMDYIEYLEPIPQIEDPENPGEFINEFADLVWAKKFLRNLIIDNVKKHKKKVTRKAISIQRDETLIDE